MSREYLFFDIETCCPKGKRWDEIPIEEKKWFANEMADHSTNIDSDEDQYHKACCLKAELSCVSCISFGTNTANGVQIASIAIGHNAKDEVDLLTQFANTLSQFESWGYGLSGYNIKGFDIPFLERRYIFNNMKVPRMLSRDNNDPWGKNETTMDVANKYKFGSNRMEKLSLACHALGIQCKTEQEFNGTNMWRHTYDDVVENMTERILPYCEEDVRATIQLYNRIKNI